MVRLYGAGICLSGNYESQLTQSPKSFNKIGSCEHIEILAEKKGPRSSQRHILRQLTLFLVLIILPAYATAQFTKTITVTPGVQVNAVTTWDFYNCLTIAVGSYTISVPPKQGSLSFADESLPIPNCTTGPQPATVAFYTWTGTTPGVTSDFFELDYYVNGQLGEVIDVTVELASGCGSTTGSSRAFAAAPAGASLVQVTLVPAPADDTYLIDATPAMPLIQAKAAITGICPDPTPNATFTWTAHLEMKENGGVGKTIDYDNDIVQNATTKGSGLYTFSLKHPGAYRGGRLTLTASTIFNGQTLTGTTPDDLVINGTNAPLPAVQDALGTAVLFHTFHGVDDTDVTDGVQRVACQESKQLQFNSTDDPRTYLINILRSDLSETGGAQGISASTRWQAAGN